MQKVGIAIRTIDTSRPVFRPCRSPKYPLKIAPMGRIIKPVAKTPYVIRIARRGFVAGKKFMLICLLRKPKIANSYHSNQFPTRQLRIIFLIFWGGVIGGCICVFIEWPFAYGCILFSVHYSESVRMSLGIIGRGITL